MEAVRKPLLLLAGDDGADATNGTNGTTTKHRNAQTQNVPRHLGALAGYSCGREVAGLPPTWGQAPAG